MYTSQQKLFPGLYAQINVSAPKQRRHLAFTSFSDIQADYGSWSNWSICVNSNKTCNNLGSMNRTRNCLNSSNQSKLADKYCRGYNIMMDSCMPCVHYGMICWYRMIWNVTGNKHLLKFRFENYLFFSFL